MDSLALLKEWQHIKQCQALTEPDIDAQQAAVDQARFAIAAKEIEQLQRWKAQALELARQLLPEVASEQWTPESWLSRLLALLQGSPPLQAATDAARQAFETFAQANGLDLQRSPQDPARYAAYQTEVAWQVYRQAPAVH